MKTAILKRYAFLLSGPYFPTEEQKIKQGTLQLASNRYFTMQCPDGLPTIMYADDFARVRSLKQDMTPYESAMQHLAKAPLAIRVIPKGVARAAFLTDPQKWQAELCGFVREKISQTIQTIPVRFTYGHLKLADQSRSEQDARIHRYFKEQQGPLAGQLIPKLQVVFVLVPSRLINKDKIDDYLPSINTQANSRIHVLNTPEVKDDLSYLCSLTAKKLEGDFKVYCLVDLNNPLHEGTYTIKFDKNLLSGSLLQWCNQKNLDSITYSLDVKLGISNLIGDFDLHIIDAHNLEEAVIGQFPQRYADTFIGSLYRKENGQTNQSQNRKDESSLSSWAMKYEWINAHRKLAIGAIDGETDERMNSLATIGFELLNALSRDDQEAQLMVTTLQGAWDGGYGMYEAVKAWNSFDKVKAKADAVYKKVLTQADGPLLERIWRAGRARDFVTKHLQSDVTKVLSFTDKVGDMDVAKHSEATIAMLLKDGIPEEYRIFDEMVANQKLMVAAKVMAALDVAVCASKIMGLWYERNQLDDQAHLHQGRFSAAAKKYQEKYFHKDIGYVCNSSAISTLEALRCTADTMSMKLEETERHLVISAVDAALNVMVYVPEVGQIIALVLIMKNFAQGMASLIGNLARVVDKTFFDSMGAQALYKWRDLGFLARQSSVNQTGLEKSLIGRDLKNDPAVQFRVRAEVLCALVGLIARLGPRVNKKEDFSRKFEQYDIKGFIDNYILIPIPDAVVPAGSKVPLDELWFYQRGCAPNFRVLSKLSPLTDHDTPNPDAIVHWVPVHYQDMFPIHGMQSMNALKLAELLCKDYTSVKSSNVVFSRIYVKRKGAWVQIEQDDRPILATDELRIIVVFESEDDISGMPVTIQLVRVNTLFDTHGPKYKTGLGAVPTFASENNGEDKGLLIGTEEEHYISDRDKRYYSCVVHPFYIFQNKLFRGAKPIDHIGLSIDASMQARYVITAGAMNNEPIHTGPSRDDTFTVHMPIENSLFCNMILDSQFLANKTSNATRRKVFDRGSKLGVLGLFIKHRGVWKYFDPDEKEVSFPDFDFSWTSGFSLLFVLSAFYHFLPEDTKLPVRLPAWLHTTENTWIDCPGPAYPTQLCMFDRKKHTKHWSMQAMCAHMYKHGLLKENERVHAESISRLIPSDRYVLLPDIVLFAARVDCAYSVEDDTGRMQTYMGFKPFGEFFNKPDTHDLYDFRLELKGEPGVGLEATCRAKLRLPPIGPDTKGRAFLHDEKFVTNGPAAGLLSVQQSDYQ